MNSSTFTDSISLAQPSTEKVKAIVNNLSQADINQTYKVKEVVPVDQDVVDFLFSLGCFKGEDITLMSILSDCYIVSINGARYSLSSELAELVLI